MSENKFEAAARLLKALAKLDEKQTDAARTMREKYDTKRAELLAGADDDVREMVEKERES